MSSDEDDTVITDSTAPHDSTMPHVSVPVAPRVSVPVEPVAPAPLATGVTSLRTRQKIKAGLLGGRYELLEFLSEGGMGRIFKACHRDLNKQVIVKMISERHKEKDNFREAFFREARLASSLRHPGIVEVTDFGLDETRGYYIVMELLEGETLREWMSNRTVPSMRRAMLHMLQVLEAVSYVHRRGIIHCDLKPENIFLAKFADGTTHAKLLDFGLSWNRETSEVSTAGSIPYLAPERLDGQFPSPENDIYSLGVILYELVTSKRPFEGTSAIEILAKQINEKPLSPCVMSLEPIDERIDDITLKALSIRPHERQANATALLYEFRTFLNMMGITKKRSAAPTKLSFTREEHAILTDLVESAMLNKVHDWELLEAIANKLKK